jgi:outer membrane lipoprotein carrier protein
VIVRALRSTAYVCLLLAPAAGAAAPPSEATLRAVEARYNRARTLTVDFEQRLTNPGRPARAERGSLALRKPGRMHWLYSDPAGKLFISDGKDLYFYSPLTQRAEKSRLKDAEDFRAPLAFLLGKLDFKREFRDLSAVDSAEGLVLSAAAKSNRLPFERAEFTFSPEHQIRRLVIYGADQSVMEFRFANERLNPPVDEALFRFRLPAGVELVEVTGAGEVER